MLTAKVELLQGTSISRGNKTNQQDKDKFLNTTSELVSFQPGKLAKMTTSITEVPVLPSGSFTGSRLFSKIARSPTSTRRHRGAPSQDIVNVTQTHTQGAQHSQRQQRPGYPRQISASERSQSIQRREEANQRHNSDASSNQPKSRSQMSYAPLVSEYYLPSQVAGRDGAINYMFQQMYELIQKRIATLQYMRRA